ncbi:MAG: GntR family transcriptional regulator [Deltaproteobacteria bacterium]|nr:GntR family transcriptional regulator [Deltaproteobacteria bacterium]
MVHQNLTVKVDAIKNIGEVIAQSLKEMIYEAELKPGQQLVQENIARMFGVSRVPVRDALQILINMGIAVNVPRRGVIVRPLSRKLLNELFEIRKILEGSAIKMVIHEITPDVFQHLNELVLKQSNALNKSDVKMNETLDDEFHRTLFEPLDNDTLNDLIFANWERIKQARCSSTVVAEHGKKWIKESIQRHRKVLDAIKRKDEELAYRNIVENIESSRQEITDCLEEMGWIEPGE